MDRSNAELIELFLQAVDSGDIERVSQYMHDDMVMEWPQSGERFRGRENAVRAMQGQETKPAPAGEPRILDGGQFFVVMMPLRYGEEVHHYVGVFEISDSRVARTTEYFGAPFPAADFRAQYAE